VKYEYNSDVERINSILLKHPQDAFINQSNTDVQWKKLNYLGCPDFNAALEEYEVFLSILKKHINEIHFLPRDPRVGLDSVYVRDALIMTDKGAVLSRMNKKQRSKEPLTVRYALARLKIPVLGAISEKGRLEGGDVVYLNKNTLAVGLGKRTNQEGIDQLQELVADFIHELVVVPLPDVEVPGFVLHLMSFFSPLDRDLALVYPPFMPDSFREWLEQNEYQLLEVPEDEFKTMACNVLALAPRVCVMLSGNPKTKKMLEEKGIKVYEYKGQEISVKGAGGPTCLTRPLSRV
jgi:N-dimethylarginine dimethylaminohydrolase